MKGTWRWRSDLKVLYFSRSIHFFCLSQVVDKWLVNGLYQKTCSRVDIQRIIVCMYLYREIYIYTLYTYIYIYLCIYVIHTYTYLSTPKINTLRVSFSMCSLHPSEGTHCGCIRSGAHIRFGDGHCGHRLIRVLQVPNRVTMFGQWFMVGSYHGLFRL